MHSQRQRQGISAALLTLFEKLFNKCHRLGKHSLTFDPYEECNYITSTALLDVNNSPIDIFGSGILVVWNPYYTGTRPPCHKCGRDAFSGGGGKGGYQLREVHLDDASATLVFKRLRCRNKDCSVTEFSTIGAEYLSTMDVKYPGLLNDFDFYVSHNCLVKKSIVNKVHEHVMNYGGFIQGLCYKAYNTV